MGFLSGMRQRDREHITLLNRHLEESLDHLERAQQKLIESAKLTALGRMTRDVAHEIRNPLVSIGGFARKCMATIEPDSKEMRYVKIIVHEVERLEKILRDLLMFSRGPVRQPEEIHVPTVLEKGVQINLDDLREKGINIVREIGENLPTLYGDAEQLEEAFVNLIQNAVQAMNPTGVLTLRAAPESKDGGTSVRIEIQDTGEGMSEEILERIFDPFFTTKEGAEGTGLGLSVCRRIVEEHHGTIAVQSRPGEGSIFTILLPVLRSDTVKSQMEEKVE
jgi:signal transduction histidine kinase